MKIRALIATGAILSTSFSPMAFPGLVTAANAAEPTYSEMVADCEEYAPEIGNSGKKLPNTNWEWRPELMETDSSGGEEGEVTGYSMNPASRTIHAIVVIDGGSVTYKLHCAAYNPSPQDNDPPPFSHDIEDYYTENGDAVTGRPAVCNPASTKKSGPVTTWYEIPGTSDYRGDYSCAEIAAGLLLDWSTL